MMQLVLLMVVCSPANQERSWPHHVAICDTCVPRWQSQVHSCRTKALADAMSHRRTTGHRANVWLWGTAAQGATRQFFGRSAYGRPMFGVRVRPKSTGSPKPGRFSTHRKRSRPRLSGRVAGRCHMTHPVKTVAAEERWVRTSRCAYCRRATVGPHLCPGDRKVDILEYTRVRPCRSPSVRCRGHPQMHGSP